MSWQDAAILADPKQARGGAARVAHFPGASLVGYATASMLKAWAAARFRKFSFYVSCREAPPQNAPGAALVTAFSCCGFVGGLMLPPLGWLFFVAGGWKLGRVMRDFRTRPDASRLGSLLRAYGTFVAALLCHALWLLVFIGVLLSLP